MSVQKAPFRAMVRSIKEADPLAALEGADLVAGDLNDEESVASAAEKLSDALGRRIRFVDVPPEAMRGALAGAGVPDWQADGLIEDYAHYSRGEAAEVAAGVLDATGKPPRSFDEFARDYARAFS